MSTYTEVIELNRNQAIEFRGEPGTENSDFTCLLHKPVTVEDGDEVVFWRGFVDSYKSSADTIVIGNDTQLSIMYSIYDRDYLNSNKKQLDGVADWGGPTFDYFAAYVEKTSNLVLESITLNINGFVPGDYRPPPYSRNTGGSFVINASNGIGNAIWWFTVTVAYIDANGELATAVCTGNNATVNLSLGGWITTGPTIVVTPVTPVTFKKNTLTITAYGGWWPDETVAPTVGSCPPGETPGPLVKARPVLATDFILQSVNAVPAPDGGAQLDLKMTSVTVPAGRYDPRSLAIYITQLFNTANGVKASTSGNQYFMPKNQFLQRTDDPDNADMFLRLVDFTHDPGTIQFTNANSYRYNVPTFIGASQFALEYGSAGNAFSLNYAHMPLANPASPGTQNIGYYWTGTIAGNDLRYYTVDAASGILIHDLQPATFWRDKLGLYNQLICPLGTDDAGVKYYLPQNLTSKITAGYDPLGSFLLLPPAHAPGVAPLYTNPRVMEPEPPELPGVGYEQVVFIETTGSTKAIIGNSLGVGSDGGYLAIEITGLPPREGNYVDATGVYPNICDIVSLESLVGVIVGESDSGINYTYRGSPFVITSCRVRYLNADKTPSLDLGKNNAVIIHIIKPDPIDSSVPKNPKK